MTRRPLISTERVFGPAYSNNPPRLPTPNVATPPPRNHDAVYAVPKRMEFEAQP